MERRAEQRKTTYEPAAVTVLGSSIPEMPARILDSSGRGMRLLLERALPLAAAVKVETEDGLVLGEVCYSTASSAGVEVGLELKHSLVGLKELARLNRQLVNGWRSPVLLEDEVAARRR